jgi:DNA-binding response OmpR family regulator
VYGTIVTMRILVAEDEPGMAGFLRKGLGEAGYAVDWADNGEEALALIGSASYDLLVLDILMPRMDGLAVLRKIRERRESMPVLMLTARDEIEDKVRGLDAGADDYLTKPFAFAELLARVRALLRRPQEVSATILRWGSLEMHLARHVVTLGNEPLDLSRREFALLELFLRNPGQVLTRTQISQSVWENTFDTGTNVVDVYIGYLRRKAFGNEPERGIETIRAVGYRLRDPRP